jgi:DNA recombination protein RmuC
MVMNNLLVIASTLGIILFIQCIFVFVLLKRQNQQKDQVIALNEKLQTSITQQIHQLQLVLQQAYQTSQLSIHEKMTQGQLLIQQLITETLTRQMIDIREQMQHSFKQHAESLTKHLQSLTEDIRSQLHSLTHQVNHRLAEGFEKTSTTFTDIVRRLAIIDEAQKKITELSQHVVNLQDVLVDKKSRGAFGEVQLSALIANAIPANHYGMQYTLSNGKRADCILFLPEPTGNIVIDAKFPLENYQRFMGFEANSTERKSAQQQFKLDVQKHLKDIAEKYILPGETCDGAMMFIPAEAIFAEIHANYPEIIALSQKMKVWIVSPTTLMAVLTTARAVLKDDATRKQIHVIQQHLHALAEDFQRFEKRMDKLTKHIDLAHQDVNEVNTSAKKITQRFQKIEQVELELQALPVLTTSSQSDPLDTVKARS